MKAMCPKCLQESDAVQVEDLLKCGHCEEWFPMPVAPEPEPVASAPAPVPAPAAAPAQPAPTPLENRVAGIRAQASMMSVLSILFWCLAVIFFLAALNTGTGMYIFSGLLAGIGFWLYLVAQIVYIRANTEK